MTQVCGTTLPVRFSAGGGTDGILSLPGIEHIIYVDKGPATGTEDGTQQDPYHVIDDALTAAKALSPTATTQVVIYIYPGIYAESSLTGDSYIHLVGAERDSTILQAVDDAIYTVLDSASVSIENLTFDGQGYGNAGTVLFDSCTNVRVFNCYIFVNTGSTANAPLRFDDCEGSIIANKISTSDATTRALKVESVTAGRSLIIQDNVIFGRVDLELVGGLYQGNVSEGPVQVHSVDLVIANNSFKHNRSVMTISNPSGFVSVIDNTFDGGLWWDIVGDSPWPTNISVKNNVMHGTGMNYNVRPVEPVRYVGQSGDKDFYAKLSDAVTSVNQHDTTIYMLKDETITAAIIPTDYRTIVDGLGHKLTRTNNTIFQITNSDDVTLKNMEYEGNLYYSVAAEAHIEFLFCTLVGLINVNAGTSSGTVRITDCTCTGDPSDGRILRIADPDPSVYVTRSYLKGANSTYPIQWVGSATATASNLYVKFSSFMHASLGTNNPFGRNSTQTPTYSSYQCAYNSDPESGGIWTNNIVGAALNRDTIDVNTDY